MKSFHILSGKILLFIIFLTASSFLNAQSKTDFSGTWVKDQSKSDDFYKEFEITLIINQTPGDISIKKSFKMIQTGEVVDQDRGKFMLNGKEEAVEEQGGINKRSASWSADGKKLLLKETRTVGSDIYGSTEEYSLSDNGKVLTIILSDINPSGLKVKLICNKK